MRTLWRGRKQPKCQCSRWHLTGTRSSCSASYWSSLRGVLGLLSLARCCPVIQQCSSTTNRSSTPAPIRSAAAIPPEKPSLIWPLSLNASKCHISEPIFMKLETIFLKLEPIFNSSWKALQFTFWLRGHQTECLVTNTRKTWDTSAISYRFWHSLFQ